LVKQLNVGNQVHDLAFETGREIMEKLAAGPRETAAAMNAELWSPFLTLGRHGRGVRITAYMSCFGSASLGPPAPHQEPPSRAEEVR